MFFKRALFISITTPRQDLFRSIGESLLVKKTVYKQYAIDVMVRKPAKLKVLYIAREGKTRQILNEQELLENLQTVSDQIEIEKKYFGGLSFTEQVELMSETDIVFGVHGAAFINILFMRPKSGLMEFFSPIFYVAYYESIATKSHIIYSKVKNNKIERVKKEEKKKNRDPRNANLFINVQSTVNKFSIMVNNVMIEKYKLVDLCDCLFQIKQKVFELSWISQMFLYACNNDTIENNQENSMGE